MSGSRRVVVLLKRFLGDAVLAAPTLEALREAAEVFVAAPPAIADVLGPPWRDRFLALERPGLAPMLRALRLARADVALVVNRSFRSALAARLAGVPVRVGYGTEARAALLSRPLRLDPEEHEAETYARLARAAGFELERAESRLFVSEAERIRGAELLGEANAVLQPGASHDYKRLPVETLREVAGALAGEGLRFALVGGPEEEELAARFGPEFQNLVGRCTLRETMGVLAASRLAVGGDTGVMHLAAGVGCPSAVVFGPSQPAARWAHAPPLQVAIQADEQVAEVSAERLLAAARAALAGAASRQ